MTSSISCTNPASIRALNRGIEHRAWWSDPEYQVIETAFLLANPFCEYCSRPSTVAHHDKPEHYRSKETYYNPLNMTPACGPCHFHYRRGLEICPVCLAVGEYHYMVKGKTECSRHGVAHPIRIRRRDIHPCRFHSGPQKCRKKIACPYPPRKAEECNKFERKEMKPI
jgi:hypothetical protein